MSLYKAVAIASLIGTIAVTLSANAQPSATPSTPVASTLGADLGAANLRFKQFEVFDTQFKDIRMGSIVLPDDWVFENRSVWAYNQIYHPFRGHMIVHSPDSSVFTATFPMYTFMWASGALANQARQGPSLGPIDARPQITAAQAVEQAIVMPFRGKSKNLQIIGWRSVPTLPGALANKQQGESIVMRIRYQLGNAIVDEDIYAFFEKVFTGSTTGPYGTSYEHHRWLRYVHSYGASNGKLAQWYPVLAYMNAQVQPDPRWGELHSKIYQRVNDEFWARIKRGYDGIRAAGEASRAISAQNDAMIASLRTQRAANNASRESMGRGFNEYIRGVERVQDPGTGKTLEVSSGSNYYWRSAQGTIVGTNSTSNPNVGSTTSWQPLTPLR